MGCRTDEAIANRFARFFSSVQAEPRYTLALSSDEFVKQFDNYGAPFDRDFIDYLRGLSFDERRAFDIAMGYIFARVSDLNLQLPSSGLYLLLKASNVAPEPFYNAHRERGDLFHVAGSDPRDLDRNSRAVFGNGWYAANVLPPVARWMNERSWLRFEAEAFSHLRLQLTTHMPNLRASPLELQFELNGERICGLCLFDYGWLELRIEIPEHITRASSEFRLDIRASRTWQPSQANPESSDDRHLSIAVCKLALS